MKQLLFLAAFCLPVMVYSQSLTGLSGNLRQATTTTTQYEPVTSIDQMAGNWTVYKRTSDHILEKVDYTRQIKRAEILSSPKDGKWGYFFAGMDGSNTPSWFVESYARQVITLSGKGKRWFKVIKAQDNELILEENGITYFFKQFNK